MPQLTATEAAPARAAEARVDWIEPCPELQDPAPALTGWRVGLAAAVVAVVLALVALPVVAAVAPALASHAASWLERLAGIGPVMAGLRALFFVVAAVVISRRERA